MCTILVSYRGFIGGGKLLITTSWYFELKIYHRGRGVRVASTPPSPQLQPRKSNDKDMASMLMELISLQTLKVYIKMCTQLIYIYLVTFAQALL